MLRLFILIFLITATPAVAEEAEPSRRALLDAFFAAFNDQDADTMGDLVAENIQIVYLGLSGIDSRVDGSDRMVQSMRRYFSDLPSARSEILSVIEDGNRLAVRERVSWTASDGTTRSQTALSVYRVRGNVIAAVWYFPATAEQN